MRPKPKGFGAVWTLEEIEIMHKLEKELQGDKRIANKMCKYLPQKTNKQIRDKRAQLTYKSQVQAILGENSPEQSTNLEAAGDGQIPLEGQEEDEIGRRETGTGEGDLDGYMSTGVTCGNVTAATATAPIIVPTITITDCSRGNPEDSSWRETFLQAAIDPRIAGKIPKETEGIVDMLKQAIIYAKEEDGLVPVEHIDYIYNQVESYMKEVTGEIGNHVKAAGVKKNTAQEKRQTGAEEIYICADPGHVQKQPR
jgi:hypothetical protein